MKLSLKLPLPIATLLLVAGVSVAPVQAQFVVHDPINEIQLIYQNGTLAQQLTESLKLFSLAWQETSALRNRNYMLAAGYLSNFSQAPIAGGHSNWTIGLSTAGGIIPAGAVWRSMTTVLGSRAYGVTIQNRLALVDAMGPSMIDALGGCNAAMIQSHSAIGALEQFAMSSGSLDNTNDALGGATNAGIVQQLRVQECQQNIQQQQAQLQLLQAMRQRDYDNAQLNLYNNITTTATSNPHNISNISGIYTAYFQ